MAQSSDSSGTVPMNGRERFLWQAAVAALVVHVAVLASVHHWGALSEPAGVRYAEVGLADFAMPEVTRTMEEAVREKMESRMEAVRNVVADSRAESRSDVRSSGASEADLAQDVEAELRAFEQSAFDALAEGREGVSAPESAVDAPKSGVENRYSNWDARYDGQVTAEFDLAGRKALVLDVPGYRCRGGGTVVVAIEVAPGGEVLAAKIASLDAQGDVALGECLSAESLRSAAQCRFTSKADAPKRQAGKLTYRFVAQ